MHDAVELERRGVPTGLIVTDAFLHEADLQRTALGAELLAPVVIAHPLSTLTTGEIAARGAAAAVGIRKVLTGGGL